MKKWSCFLQAIFVLLFLFAHEAEASPKKETLEKNLSVDPTLPVSLEFDDVDGSLKFSSWEKNIVKIRVTKETKTSSAKRAEKLLRETEVEISQRKNEINVKINYPRIKGIFFWLRDFSRIKVSTEIMLPLLSNVDCKTVDGSVYGENIDGEIAVRTIDGSIRLTDIKPAVRAKTTDGRIIIKNVAGEVDASTIDGDIDITGQVSKLTVTTIDGDITVRVLPDSRMEDDWNLTSSDGDVELYLWQEFHADFYFQTGDGDLRSDIPLQVSDFLSKRKISGKLNQGGNLLRIRTSDGDISIRMLPLQESLKEEEILIPGSENQALEDCLKYRTPSSLHYS